MWVHLIYVCIHVQMYGGKNAVYVHEYIYVYVSKYVCRETCIIMYLCVHAYMYVCACNM